MIAVLGWPDARAAEVAGAEVVVGRLDAVEASMQAAPPGDLIDAGRRRGEQLRLFLRRRAVLRLLVGRRLGADPGSIALGYDRRGAPVVRAPVGRLRVSVSARGELAAFALATGPVGVDLEPLVDPGPIDSVLTPSERTAVAEAADVGGMRLRFWTAKEAYLKALGTGLARDPAGIEVVRRARHQFAMRAGARTAAGSGAWLGVELAGAPILVAVWVDASRVVR